MLQQCLGKSWGEQTAARLAGGGLLQCVEGKRGHGEPQLRMSETKMEGPVVRMQKNVRFELMERLVLQEMGVPLQSLAPVPMSIDAVAESIWPINAELRPNLEQIRALPYEARFERQADEAVAERVLSGVAWSQLPAQVWRVLLERHFQCLQLLAFKAAEAGDWGAQFMSVPMGAPVPVQQRLAMLFLLFETPLPFPVVDRSGVELPSGTAPGPLTRQ